jgi:dihydropteroate synthase
MIPPPALRAGGRWLTVDRPLVMGVVNASPESFSDGAARRSVDEQLRHVDELVAAGADIIDVGGQSAVTNQPELDAQVERDRVLPIVRYLAAQHPDTLVSVDTYKPLVVEQCLAAGAAIINDVSGLRHPEIVESCVRHQSGLVIMHTAAPPKKRLQNPNLYDDVVDEVVNFLTERVAAAVEAGLPAEAIVLDPGPDFTKTPFQTVAVLRNLDRVRALGRPVLLALSRKDFLGAILRRSPRGRDAGTLAAITYLVGDHPGSIVRVHDVAAARDVLRVLDVLTGRAELDPNYVLPDSLRYEPT